MLRKVGNLGKIARRHSLMGLTNMFNKDKDGRDGIQEDSFGVASTSTGDLASKKAVKPRKSEPVAASVSHATVELDSNKDGMTPAAHYVRQHQIQMRQQAEAEAKVARERQEAEAKAKAAAAAAAAPSPVGASKGKTTDDVVESRQKMIEKEKERLKSKRGWRNRLRVGSTSIDSTGVSPTGLETVPNDAPIADYIIEDAPKGIYAGGAGSISAPSAPPQLDEQKFDTAFDGEDLVPPHMPAAGSGGTGEDSGDEYETDSLRHWGEGIEKSRASAALVKQPKGVLKKSASSSQLSQLGGMPATFDRPFAGRVRANSYDAPQASAAPGAPMLSAMSTSTAANAAMERQQASGLARQQPQGGGGKLDMAMAGRHGGSQ